MLALPFALAFMTVTPVEQTRVDDAAADRRSVPPRSGFLLGLDVAPGVVLVPHGFAPVIRTRHAVGGGVTDRFTLAAEVGGTFHLGIDKGGSFDTDVVATGFVGRRLALRAGLGVSSRSLARAEPRFRPAAGGLAGLGYELAIFSHGALRIGVDYDLRLRTDGRPVQAVFLALGFRLYPKKTQRR